jgi:hypothetical protein
MPVDKRMTATVIYSIAISSGLRLLLRILHSINEAG